jgi:hypothetical protein
LVIFYIYCRVKFWMEMLLIWMVMWVKKVLLCMEISLLFNRNRKIFRNWRNKYLSKIRIQSRQYKNIKNLHRNDKNNYYSLILLINNQILMIYEFYKLYIKYNHNTHRILLHTFYLASIPSKKLLTSGYLK